jgi:protein-L-isoaspartate(D-aspartate) O-methyltransferase
VRAGLREVSRDDPLVDAAVASGVRDEAVLAAMRSVRRSNFVPPDQREMADWDMPIPIGYGQTTSQPSLIALMIESVEVGPSDTVLEIGSGLGYETALLAQICKCVRGVELFPQLAEQANANLRSAGVHNATVVAGDGTLGLPESAPFDAVIVCAAAPTVAEPLVEQIREGGRIVQPMGPGGAEKVTLFVKEGTGLSRRRVLTAASFVKLRMR